MSWSLPPPPRPTMHESLTLFSVLQGEPGSPGENGAPGQMVSVCSSRRGRSCVRGQDGGWGQGGCLPSHLVPLGLVVRAPVVCLVREVALEPLALL